MKVYIFIKITYCVIWKENRKDSLLNAVDESERNFIYVKNKVIEDNSSQRICIDFLGVKQKTK